MVRGKRRRLSSLYSLWSCAACLRFVLISPGRRHSASWAATCPGIAEIVLTRVPWYLTSCDYHKPDTWQVFVVSVAMSKTSATLENLERTLVNREAPMGFPSSKKVLYIASDEEVRSACNESYECTSRQSKCEVPQSSADICASSTRRNDILSHASSANADRLWQ